jgi:ATP-dependent Clp protease adaptor protein ClpS
MARPRIDADHGYPDFGLAVEERRKTKRPRPWKVLIWNDDFTTQEFVVYILIQYFRKPPAEATHIMLQVHHKGVGIAGIYPKDVAETKVAEATAEAREHQMPLKLEARPAEDGEDS